MSLTIATGNLHNTRAGIDVLLDRAGVDALMRHEPDSAGFSEANRVLRVAHHGYRLVIGRDFDDDRPGPSEVSILTKLKWPAELTMAIQASETVQPDRFGPARIFVVSGFKHPEGRIAHIAVHPNATVMNRGSITPIVREYDESMRTLNRLVGFLKREAFKVVVSGDLNWRRHHQSIGFLDPYEVFKRHDLAVHTEGIDAIAHTRNLKMVGGLTVIDKATLHSDHPGLVAKLESN